MNPPGMTEKELNSGKYRP